MNTTISSLRYRLWCILPLTLFALNTSAAPAKDSPGAVCTRIMKEANAPGNSRQWDAMKAQNSDLSRKVREFDTRIRAANATDELAALELMREKLAFVDAAPGCKFTELKQSLESLAELHQKRERYREAEPYRVRLLELALEEHPAGELWRARRDLARVLESQAKLAEALPHLQAALVEQPEVIRRDTGIVGILANNLLRQKRFAEAEPYFRELGHTTRLAEALEGQGKWKEAEDIWRRERPTESTLKRLEANLRSQGRVADAVKAAEQAFSLRQAEANPTVQEREQRAAQSRKAADIVESLGNKSAAAMLRDQAARQAAVPNTAPTGPSGPDAAQLETIKINVTRQIREAERQGNKAMADGLRSMLAMMDQNAGRGSPAWASPAPNLGLAPERAALALMQIQVGKMAEAEALLKETCPVLVKRDRIDLPKDSSWDLRSVMMSPAQCYRELALSTVKSRKGRAGTLDEDLFQAAQWATQSDAGSALTRTAARKYATSLGAARSLEEIDSNLAAMSPHAERIMAMVKPLLPNDKNAGAKAGTMDMVFALMKEVQQLDSATRVNSQAIDRLYQQLQLQAPEYSALRNPEPIALASLLARSGPESKLLLPDEALIVWMSAPGARTGLVFAISKEKSAWATMGLTGDEIAQRVTRLRSQIDPCAYGIGRSSCKDDSLSFDRLGAHELYMALLGQPEISEIVNAKGIRNLLIVPSGALTTLPPGILVTSPPVGSEDLDKSPQGWALADWLILKRSITILPAVSTLSSLRGARAVQTIPSSRSADDRLFMFADPDFAGTGQKPINCSADQMRVVARSTTRYFRSGTVDRQALAALAPLPCTRREGELLRQQLGGTVLFGRDAREAQLRDRDLEGRLSRSEVLAFATHGLVSGDLGLGEPALALAAPLAGDGTDDGVLTASEVMRLKLSADIVLLSACNTASPDASDAEGLSGLAKAFFHAGAKGVLVSHWRVDDAATAALVVETVRLRRTGLSKAEALQNSSIAMMKGKIGAQDEAFRERRAHPSIWAPFTLIGEAR